MPTATSGEHLLKLQRATTNLGLVPPKSAEVVEGREHRCGKDATGAESAACRNRREHGELNAAAKLTKLLGEGHASRLVAEACKHQGSLGNGERTAHTLEIEQLFGGFHDL